MTKGLKFALGILVFGCAIPLLTAFLTLRNKPVYHTHGFNNGASYIQFTWQEKPVANLEHVLIFLEKPEMYKASSGLDVRPPEDFDGYWIFPRGVFYKGEPLLQPVKKIIKRQKKDIRVWIVHKGKAFTVELSPENNQSIKSLVTELKNHQIDAITLSKELLTNSAWNEVTVKLTEFQEKAANGKIDFTPRKRRSQFMNF